MKRLNKRQKICRVVVYTLSFLTVEIGHGLFLGEVLYRLFS